MSPAQCRAARAMLGWNQADLADEARVSVPTIVGFERGSRDTEGHIVAALRAALERAGLRFADDGSDGVRRK